MTLQDSLRELAEASAELNTEADAVNEKIEAVEAAIKEAQPGITFWSGIDVLQEESTDENAEPIIVAWELGYGREGFGWSLMCRTSTCRASDVQEGPWENGPGRPLMEASRQVRIAAAPHLGDFVDKLTAEVRETAQALRLGKVKSA
jgi:hypothetical protein